MNTLFVRLSSTAVVCAALVSALLPASVCADDRDQLNNEEKAYVAAVEAALDRAFAVTTEIDEIAQGGLIESIFIKGEASSGTLTAVLDQADRVLAECAGVLDQTPPFSMTTVQSSYVGTAEIFEAGYGDCRALVVEEGENAALEWGKDVLGGIYGMGGDSSGGGLAATARIKGCIASRSTAIRETSRGARELLVSKIDEIQANREPTEAESDLFGSFADACFIATAAYGTNSAEEIDVLRDFRDEVLAKSAAGRDYIGFYYAASPPIADFIARHEVLRTLVRELVVDPIVRLTALSRPFWPETTGR